MTSEQQPAANEPATDPAANNHQPNRQSMAAKSFWAKFESKEARSQYLKERFRKAKENPRSHKHKRRVSHLRPIRKGDEGFDEFMSEQRKIKAAGFEAMRVKTAILANIQKKSEDQEVASESISNLRRHVGDIVTILDCWCSHCPDGNLGSVDFFHAVTSLLFNGSPSLGDAFRNNQFK